MKPLTYFAGQRGRTVRLAAIPLVCLGWGPVGAVTAQEATLETALAHVPPKVACAAVGRPAALLQSPGMELLPVEVLTALGNRDWGFDPARLERVVIVLSAEDVLPSDEPAKTLGGLILQSTVPFSLDKLFPSWFNERDVIVENMGYRMRRSKSARDPSLCLVNDRTLIIAPDALFQAMLAAPTQENPLREQLRALAGNDNVYASVLLVDAIRPQLQQHIEELRLPPALQIVKDLPNKITSLEAQVTTGRVTRWTLTIRTPSESAARQVEGMIRLAMDVGREAAIAGLAFSIQRSSDARDPVAQAGIRYARRVADVYYRMFVPKREGTNLVVSVEAEAPALAVTGVMVALLLPAVQAAREAARRVHSSNNMKQIGVALHNYHDVHGQFPPRVSMDPQGRPLLSWRVHILPYLGEGALYKQFHLDEPWDSAHNLQLLDRMPATYRNPNLSGGNVTNYLAINGDHTVFGGARGTSMAMIIDGAFHTLLIVEADEDRAVPWTKPDDLDLDATNPLAGLGGFRHGGFLALFADGHIQFLSEDLDAETFRRMTTKDALDAVEVAGVEQPDGE